MSRRSAANRWWYSGLRAMCRVASVVLFRVRCHGREHYPRSGSALVLSNHQSHLDPILVGQACNRRMNFLARETLFGFAPFRWLILSLDAIPIDRDGLGLAGLKETLRRLKHGEMVLIFPEGARTSDGRVAPLKPGFSSVALRANVPLVPVGIEGAYESWPRRNLLPWPAVIHVVIAPPLSPEEAHRLDERALSEEMERRMRLCHLRAVALRRLALRGPTHSAHAFAMRPSTAPTTKRRPAR
jgi:1-acyl-sn-glycerol-3-phosphate acyltransferase